MIRKLNVLLVCVVLSLTSGFAQPQTDVSKSAFAGREHLLMDFNWRFALGHAANIEKDFYYSTSYFSYFAKTGYGNGAASASFEDRTWREVNLPHDWAAELPLSQSAGHSHGYRMIGWQYPENSVGWYRKKFNIPASDLGRKISIQFDGVHRNATVWVNGFYVGQEPCGYMEATYDVTDYLNYGGENTVAVRVDASTEEGWFYEGAGIYRHVWLNKADRLRVADHGTFVTSKINGDNAVLDIRTTIKNQYSNTTNFTLEQTLIGADNKVVASLKSNNLSLAGNLEKNCFQQMKVDHPTLWSLENPYLYQLKTSVLVDGKIIDQYTTNVGVRAVRFDPNQGFFLNEKHVVIKGVNNHQDHAGVGTAIPEALQEWRVLKLKEMGCNAIRTSHNPPTPELLDICDRLGVMILDENRLMGINDYHFDQVKRLMVRDRNHPCVVIWSLGNEEWAIEGNDKGAMIMQTMQEYAMTLDSSRAFTAAVSGGWDTGIGRSSQVMGYNYIVQGDIDRHHKLFPWQGGIGTEESNTIGTRGIYVDDRANGHMAAINRMPENVGTESGWQFYAARPFLAGLFYWTGFDYHGEAYPTTWPCVNSQFGIIDLCGFPKDIFYYLKAWWGTEPSIHFFPHANWKDSQGKSVKVTIYANTQEVELVLNKKSLGKKTVPINGHVDWDITYQPGTLVANGYTNGKVIVSQKMETTGEAAKVAISADRTQLNADGQDVAVVTIQIDDAKNRMVADANEELLLSISGPGKIVGVGNGDPASHDPEQYVETIDRLNMVNAKFQEVDSLTAQNPTIAMLSGENGKPAFNGGYGVYTQGQFVVFTTEFNLSDFNDQTVVTLYSKSLAANQSVFVNGKLVGKNIQRNDNNQVFEIDHNSLKKGVNVVTFVGKPFVKQYQWDEINTNPGVVKVFTPASQWKVKSFNGLAQVIVKTSQQAGEITLTATSGKLTTGVLKLQSNNPGSAAKPKVE